jgi:hypothetical protein
MFSASSSFQNSTSDTAMASVQKDGWNGPMSCSGGFCTKDVGDINASSWVFLF